MNDKAQAALGCLLSLGMLAISGAVSLFFLWLGIQALFAAGCLGR